jgi:ribosomal protein S18 acetylase RimI-like enzyme
MCISERVADFFTHVGTIPISTEDVQQHINNKTILVLHDGNCIIAAARWMWIGNVGHIIDIGIKKEYRNRKILRQMLELGLQRNPDCEAIAFDREVKYPHKRKTVIQVRRKT